MVMKTAIKLLKMAILVATNWRPTIPDLIDFPTATKFRPISIGPIYSSSVGRKTKHRCTMLQEASGASERSVALTCILDRFNCNYSGSPEETTTHRSSLSIGWPVDCWLEAVDGASCNPVVLNGEGLVAAPLISTSLDSQVDRLPVYSVRLQLSSHLTSEGPPTNKTCN